MKRREKKKWGYAALAVIALTAVVVLIVWAAGRKGAQELPVAEAPTRSEEPDIRVVYKERKLKSWFRWRWRRSSPATSCRTV